LRVPRLSISWRGIGRVLARLAWIAGGSARILRLLRVALLGVTRLPVRLALLAGCVAGRCVARRRWGQLVAAIGAGLGARLVPGYAAVGTRSRLVGLHKWRRRATHATGWPREPFGRK